MRITSASRRDVETGSKHGAEYLQNWSEGFKNPTHKTSCAKQEKNNYEKYDVRQSQLCYYYFFDIDSLILGL